MKLLGGLVVCYHSRVFLRIIASNRRRSKNRPPAEHRRGQKIYFYPAVFPAGSGVVRDGGALSESLEVAHIGELPVSLSGPIANPTTRRLDFCSLVLSQLDSKLQ
jgi:hypothetical protein